MHRIRRPSALALIPAGLFLLGGAIPAEAQVVQSAAVGTAPREIVYNASALRPIVQAAKTRRIDIAGIGDSNQVAGPGSDFGWDHGYSKAWSDRFGWYGTGVFGMNSTGGWNGPQGYVDSSGPPFGATATGAPAALQKYRLYHDSQSDGENDFPPSYAYFGPDYRETAKNWQPTTSIQKASPLYGQNLTWHLTYGTFATGNGGFTPAASSWGTVLAQGPRINSSTGTAELKDFALNLPATAYANAPGEISFGVSAPRAASLEGPFYGLWQRVESDRTTGVSYSTMLWQGGRALVNAATALKEQSDEAVGEYLRSMVKLQNGAPMLLVNVNHGGNDAGQTIPSVGPNPAPSNTPAGFADDMEAVIIRMRSAWIANGYDPKNLVFQYGPYHPVSDETYTGSGVTRVQRLAGWEEAVVDLSKRKPEYNLAVVRGTRLTTPITMDRTQWYDSDGQAHLSPEGYIGIAELGVRQIVGYTQMAELQSRSTVTSLSFTFDTDVSANLSPDDLLLREIQSDTLIDPSDLAVDWDAKSRTAIWTFQGLPLGELPVGEYQAKLMTTNLGYTFTFTAAPIPEPATLGLVAMAGLTMLRRRRRA